MRSLVFIEYENDEITSATLSTLSAAQQIGCPIDALVVGQDCQAIAEKAKALPKVETVYVADDASVADLLPENVAPLIVNMAKDYQYILQPHSGHGRNIMPRVAALLDTPQVSDIIEVVNENTYVRPIYAGNAYVTVKNPAEKQLLTVRAINFEPVEATGGDAEIKSVEVQPREALTTCEGFDISKSDLPELGTAKIVVSGGRGLGSKENFHMLEEIANKLNAAVGASRAAVDAGYVTNDYQVGQTGKVVSPDLYIAVGLSGAIQHMAGMKDSKCIVAINKDPDAPIFNNCDYGLVDDLFEALPEFNKALSN